MSEQHQFTADERRSALGMSELGAILGLSPFSSAVDVWMEKTGRKATGDETEAPGPTRKAPLYWGNKLERSIAEGFADYMTDFRGEPTKVRKDGRAYTKKDKRTQCHLDYRIVGEKSAVECKRPGSFFSGNWGAPMTDEVPENYLVQCHGQMWHVDIDQVYAVRLIGHDFAAYKIERNTDWFDLFDEKVDKFWWLVDNDKTPDIDFSHGRVEDTLRLLYPGYNGEVIHLSEECQRWTNQFNELSEDRRGLEKAEKHYKRQIRNAMGENSFGVLPNGRIWKRTLTKVKAETEPRAGFEKHDLRETTVGRLPKAIQELIN